jgi:predicted RNA polymerase sigma factor
MSPSATHCAIDAVWRIESARLIAGLTRIVRDVAVAEDLAQDALVAALDQWPASGSPDKPGAWLMVAAKRRGIDELRRRVTIERRQPTCAATRASASYCSLARSLAAQRTSRFSAVCVEHAWPARQVGYRASSVA